MIIMKYRKQFIGTFKPVHAAVSIDDTGVWKFVGKASARERTKLVSSELVKCSETDSIWVLDNNNQLKGIGVNMTFGFSAAGTVLPIVVCVSGLSEAELPGTDFLDLEIQGFCVGGGANIQNKTVGRVLFMRGTDKAKQKRFCWYQKNISYS